MSVSTFDDFAVNLLAEKDERIRQLESEIARLRSPPTSEEIANVIRQLSAMGTADVVRRLWLDRDAARAELAKAPPREPTQAMVHAGERILMDHMEAPSEPWAVVVWRAMYDAARAAAIEERG